MSGYAVTGRRKVAGFTLIELNIATVLATFAMVAVLPLQINSIKSKQADASAQRLFTLGDMAVQYRVDKGSWPGEATGCAIADVSAALIGDGFLLSAIDQSAWGTPIVTSCTPARFDLSADAHELVRAQEAADTLVTATVTQPAMDPNNDATLTTTFTAGGVPALNNVLHRIAVAGRPELNQMQTSIDMNNFDLNNVRNVDAVTAAAGTLAVSGDADFCTDDAANCSVAVNDNGRFVNQNTTDVEFELTNNGALVVSSPGGGGDLTVNGTIRAPNQRILADQGLEWGNQSRLTTYAGGDVIEIGGRNGRAGNGAPALDFHYDGLTEDYNVRFINSSNRVMTLAGSGGNLATLVVEGDGIYTNNLQVVGDIGVRDVVSSVSNKSLSQAVQTQTTVPAGTVLPVPDYCDTFGMVPQIQTSMAQAAEGPVATPLYQIAPYADRIGNTWQVNMKLTTESGVYDSGNGTMPDFAKPYNQIQVSIKCERA